MHTTVESVLVYGCDTWTLTKTLLKQLDDIHSNSTNDIKHRDDEVVSHLVVWEPTHGTRRQGRPPENTSGIWSAKLVYRRER